MPIRPSEDEEAYFHRQEMERLQQQAKEKAALMEDEHKRQLKEQHYMHCPKCGLDLHEFDFKGLKLDRCSGCGGTWFDDGEMEQLLNRGEMFDRLKSFFS
ncbi:MAG TPA: zf-TFIIB domain-containing protein [Thermoanaerobaculia bacterium]|nr:zf-TFIIB domain-containing protein [Thermoanaerobaculia bacterium]